MVNQCTAGKPLSMVIPEKGIIIACPVHPEGHFVKGNPRPILFRDREF